MSHHAHSRVQLRTVRPLGVRPQETFVLTTDEHRWTQIFKAVATDIPLSVVETPWRVISLAAPMFFYLG